MTTQSDFSNEIGAVVVIYQPDADVVKNLQLVAKQVDFLVIVDNGSSEAFRLLLQPLLNTRVELRQHSENLGIATGFNTGIRCLIKYGCKFVFTFDQDSRIPNNFIQGMVTSFHKANLFFERIGVLMPIWHNSTSNNVPLHLGEIRKVHQGISSGSLYSVEVFSELGFFVEDYFIDGVDIEFCLRCQTENWQVLQDSSLMFEHSLGREVTINLFGLKFPIIVHTASRKYFIARNRILNYRKYALHNREWFLADLWIFIRELFHVFAYENEKSKKLWYTFIGIKDAILNRTGNINPTLK
jgi:rhamnosyltransferase